MIKMYRKGYYRLDNKYHQLPSNIFSKQVQFFENNYILHTVYFSVLFYKKQLSFKDIGIYTNFIVQRHARREAGIQLHGREDWIPSLVSGFRLPCRNDGVLQKLCRYLCFKGIVAFRFPKTYMLGISSGTFVCNITEIIIVCLMRFIPVIANTSFDNQGDI